jgi:post-segregation antitoxin (ccd killing protein)
MVNYGKGFSMTKKMTITLEDSLIEELNQSSKSLGKKKTQIIREALCSYLDILSKEEKVKAWEDENKEAIAFYNAQVEKEGLILNHSRMF